MEKLQTLYDLAEQHNIGVYFYDLGDAEAAAVQDGTFCAIALNPPGTSSGTNTAAPLGSFIT